MAPLRRAGRACGSAI